MTITNGYCTLDEFRAAANITTTAEDNHAELAIESASRWIDRLSGRIFYDTGSVSARSYRPSSPWTCSVDDFSTVTGLIVKTDPGDVGTFSITWTTTTFEVHPLNGISPSGQAVPYNELRALNFLTFPVGTYHAPLQITARWGWAATPTDVKLAAIYLAQYLFASKSAPFGVAAVGDLGAIRARTPAVVADLLKPYELASALGAPLIG